MIPVDLRPQAKRNIWRNSSDDMTVRPGLRRIYAAESGREICAGFSEVNETTGETWHYVFDVATTGSKDLALRIYDDNFTVFQVFAFSLDIVPRGVTHAVVNGQMIINSPDFPPLHGLIGSGVGYAHSVASVSGSTALAPMSGIVVEWCDRVVYFNGRNMNVSDPIAVTGGDPRSLIAENQNQRPGIVYGAHEGAHGMLVVVTSAGVYGLDSGAAAVGVVGSNGSDWRLLNHTRSVDYDCSCVVNGRVFALTVGGWGIVDTDSNDEQMLSDPPISRAFADRIMSEDFRSAARMYGGSTGPVVGVDDFSAIHMADLSASWPCMSWWDSPASLTTGVKLRGILRMPDGDEALLFPGGAYVLTGDGDGTTDLTATLQMTGSLICRTPTAPQMNRRINRIWVAAESGGAGAIRASLRGEGYSKTPLVDSEGIVIGTDAWTITTKLVTTTPMTDVRFSFTRAPTRDIGFEVAADGGTGRILPQATLEESGGAEDRPTNIAPGS